MNSYVEFAFSEAQQLEAIQQIIRDLGKSKRDDSWFDNEHWLSYFDERARAKFWWPTPEELAEWERLWISTPPEKRESETRLSTPWSFNSMISAFRYGEYELGSCKEVGEGIARIEYDTWSYPYGGNGCMYALVESFDCTVVGDSDS